MANGYRTPEARQLTDAPTAYRFVGSNHTVRQSRSEARRKLELRIVVNREARSGASVTAGVFYTDFKNKIDTVKINYVDENSYDAQDVNFGKVTAKGVELLFQTAAFYGVSFKGVIPTLMQKSKAVSTMVCAQLHAAALDQCPC